MNNLNELWQNVLNYFKSKINDTVYNVWFSNIELVDFSEGTATILFPSQFNKNIVIHEYEQLFEEAFNAVIGFRIKLNYTSPEDNISTEEKNQKNLTNLSNDIFTFDNFIAGPSNKFAYTAAKAIAANPGGKFSGGNNVANYNPLFIYGSSGLGKTHLLKAISHAVTENFPDYKIVYVHAEAFTNEFIAALGNHTVDEFHEKYRNNIDVFLVDDVQFIGGKIQTEEEFFHTFNSLIENGKQVVLTSDRPPKEIRTLTERMRSRFETGLLADIQTPEFETRCAIIKRKAELLNFELDNNVIEFIAERIKSNIRQLEGSTNTMHAMCTYGGEPPTIATAQQAIKDVVNVVQPLPITIQHIVEEVSRTTGVSIEDIYSKKRNANISTARKMTFYIIRSVTDMSFKDIGKEFSKDRTTVMYNFEEMEKKLLTNTALNAQVMDIINNIKDEQQ
ncbi:MAG: chromosomal replication initiator protein DnaA [Eubacterium sp.]|nr:chromosomal replication initiator protein DnaA [Eubacterium sp.]